MIGFAWLVTLLAAGLHCDIQLRLGDIDLGGGNRTQDLLQVGEIAQRTRLVRWIPQSEDETSPLLHGLRAQAMHLALVSGIYQAAISLPLYPPKGEQRPGDQYRQSA